MNRSTFLKTMLGLCASPAILAKDAEPKPKGYEITLPPIFKCDDNRLVDAIKQADLAWLPGKNYEQSFDTVWHEFKSDLKRIDGQTKTGRLSQQDLLTYEELLELIRRP